MASTNPNTPAGKHKAKREAADMKALEERKAAEAKKKAAPQPQPTP